MKKQIHTKLGLIDIDRLIVNDIITLENDARVTATEWFLEDELVRRDVNVNILKGLSLNGEQATL